MSGLSHEYAKALFMLATEKEQQAEYKEALETVDTVFRENPAYIDFLSTYAIALQERLDALALAFSKAIPADVLSFLKILCEKKHISEFSACVEEYAELYNALAKVLNVKVTSAVSLTAPEKAALKEKLEKRNGHKIIVAYTVDPSILGGIIVEMDGKIIDSSLKKRLCDMEDVIKK